MTYIEFFDKTAVENISACLTYIPHRVIYIGDNEKLMGKHIARYERVFGDRGCTIEFGCRRVVKHNLTKAVELLSELVQTYDDCVFDITGGDETLLLALGIVCAKYPDRNIQIHRFSIRNSTLIDSDQDGATIYSQEPVLSVEENIRIYGGDVVYGDVNASATYQWDLSDDFLQDIDLIWQVCKGNVRYWNKQIGLFEVINALGKESDEGLTVTVKRKTLDAHLAQQKLKYKPAKGIISYLMKNGLLTWFDDSDGQTVTVTFKNHQIKKCLTKAGQALEMKIYTAARRVADSKGVLVYTDALNGVVIDWDGAFHDEETEHVYDTENEVDIMLMHGIVPVFVSCKNGVVTSDELYKLHTVARRFGGQYAKCVLVATSIPEGNEQGAYLRQRARDMNIKLIEGVQSMDHRELEKKLRNLWNN